MEVLAVYDDFSQGHYGDNSFRPNGWYGGYNGHHLPNGGWKVRNGTSIMSNTGMANAQVTIAPVIGGVFATTGTATWFVPIGGGAPTGLTALAASAISNQHDWCNYAVGGNSPGVAFTVFTDKTYKINAAGVTALAGSPGGMQVAQLGDHLYVANMSGLANRIRWSDTANEASWTASNVLDVGMNTDEAIVLMKRQRDSLIIATRSGAGGTSWYRLSGTPGLDQTLRSIQPRGPYTTLASTDYGPFAVEGYGARVWFSPGALDGTYGWVGYSDSDTPQVSNKIRPVNPNHPAVGTVPNQYTIASMPGYPMALFLACSLGVSTVNQRSLLYLDGAWAQMVLGGFSASPYGAGWTICAGDNTFYTAQSGSSGGAVKPRLQSWTVDNSIDTAPTPTSDSDATTVSAELHCPSYFSNANEEVQVQAIAVDYRHYSASTTFTPTVDVFGAFDSTFSSSSGTAFTVSGAPATVGQRARKVCYVGNEAFGSGFQAKLTSVGSLGVERIVVLGQRIPLRG